MLLNGNPTNTCGTHPENLGVLEVGMYESESETVSESEFEADSGSDSERSGLNFLSKIVKRRDLKRRAERLLFWVRTGSQFAPRSLMQAACSSRLKPCGRIVHESLSRAFARALRIAVQVLSVVMLLNGNPNNTCLGS